MTLLGMGGDQLHQFRLGLGPHLKAASDLGVNVQTSELLVLFVCHDYLLLRRLGW